MGVPALFRWLSRKYPKIIYPVIEEEESEIQAENGSVKVPVNISLPNPNQVEFDNLYLDMNGIVHPCTHPENGKAPRTEEEMMVAIFKYTERIVDMVRPRKLLFLAIDGVAPRAKMNQQRSRRFRSAQDAQVKAEERKENVAAWKAMGKEITEEDEQEVWDSNAITPGTPFMDLLASSLRYWTVQKMNTDSGWKNIQIIISDSSVPGEGEHKIMDYIRRQRSHSGHDPNTQHVIYGLDADLIMLALATHEPYFRVLREDVFDDARASACRICGEEGHYAAQCTADKATIKPKSVDQEKKPFIFLDVAILREYLEVELDVPQTSFPFNFEQAIDDWVLLIFFVGNDFLPHLPSLEIREGGIDTLMRIWRQELPRMGGYVTQHGFLELSRLQVMLSGLALREDSIFQRRREVEQRQDQNNKRRKLDLENGKNGSNGPSPALALTSGPKDFAAKADSIGFGAPATLESRENMPLATSAFSGSNHDIVANRRAIRMANMSAAEVLKAELAGGLAPVKIGPSSPAKPAPSLVAALDMPPPNDAALTMDPEQLDDIPGLGNISATNPPEPVDESMDVEDGEPDGAQSSQESSVIGVKRKLGEGVEDEDADETLPLPDDDEGDGTPAAPSAVEEKEKEKEDLVKLWEPGYRERYYRQKFGTEWSDEAFRKALTKSYVEGLCWVLHYYYQGAPSWQWYFPHHFAPFAADFQDVAQLDIQFEIGQPFKPFEQLMGVFPASSRKHIPEPFHNLMLHEDSPIIDFYPSTFEIDMNGKKMAWQGIALLPFIDQQRLLDAMALHYPKLSEDENARNRWGNNLIFASDEHPIYPFYERLYGKRKSKDPVPLDVKLSKGMYGSVLPDPDCLPGSTYHSPLSTVDLPDIRNDSSLSMIYLYPKQLKPHRSELLPGVRRPRQVLSADELASARRGGRGRGGGDRSGYRGGYGRGRGDDRRRNDPFHAPSNYSRNDRRYSDRGGGGGGSYHQSQQDYSYRNAANNNNYQNYQSYTDYGGYGGAPRSPARGGYGGYDPLPRTHNRGTYTPPPNRGSYNPYVTGDSRNAQPLYNQYQQHQPPHGGYNNPGGYGGYAGGGAPGYGYGDSGYGSYNNNGNNHRGGGIPRGRGRGW